MTRIFVLIITVGISLSFLSQLTIQSAEAFNLNKMLEKVAPPKPANDDGEGKKSKSGGLFGGGNKSGGLFGGGNKSGGLMGGGLPGSSSSGGSDGFQGNTTLRIACEGPKATAALYAGASEASLAQWSNPVVQDFGKTADRNGRANITSVLSDSFMDDKGLVWARKLGFYLGSFSSKKIKIEMETFLNKSESRLDIAGKIRRAANDDDLDDEDRADAKFAYALILAHFDAQHKKRDMMERYLKSAWNHESTGAMYVRGRRMYKGESYPKDVNGAHNYVFRAYDKINEINAAAEEAGEAPPDVWDEPEKLWIVFATDPEFKGHGRFQSLKAQAEQMEKALQREIDKGAGGGALASKIKRLDAIRLGAQLKLIKAFDLGEELARATKGAIELKKMSNQTAQVVKKTVSVEAETSQKIESLISKQNKKLGPKGIALASKAQRAAVYVAKESFSLIFGSYMSNPGAGGLGGMVATIKSAGNTKNLACKLNTAISDYKSRTKVVFRNEAPLKSDDPLIAEMALEGGDAS